MVKILKGIEKRINNDQNNHCIETLEIEKIANRVGFYKRSARKITASGLFMGFWSMQSTGKNTLRNLAIHTGLYENNSMSKQAIDKRLDSRMLELVQEVFKKSLNNNDNKQLEVFHDKISKKEQSLRGLLGSFNRVLLHDSTIQKIPNNLYEEFGGNQTKDGPKALMRVQAMYNLSASTWLSFSADTYSQNDQSQANFASDLLESGDLLIRDLGYFALDTLEQLIVNQYIITSLHPSVHLYTLEDERLDLLKLMRSKRRIDINVLVGAKKKIPMRLVAQKLNEHQKAKKIKEAKKKAHSTSNHSKAYYELLGYEIFLTNIESSVLSVQQIAKLYGLRWYIEIIFKAWKSYFNFKKVFEKNKMNHHRMMISIYLVLIQFIYLSEHIYQFFQKAVETVGQHLSVLKFMDVVNDLLPLILNIRNIQQLNNYIPIFTKHAVYEKRKSHKNIMLKYQYFKELVQTKQP